MLVRAVNLKKYFKTTKAVDDISFAFSSGQIVGFVGPNGAGKTTTMRIMATMDEPTDGDVFLNGISVQQYPEQARRMVGFMPDSLPEYRDVTIEDYLDFFARAFGIRCNRRHQVVQGIMAFTNLTGICTKYINTLSKGMKQRVSLARALIHDPPMLILDEPAAGLDPRARIELRELLKALAEQKKAILVSSHILSELAEICDSAIFIEKGRLLRAGSLDEIAGQDVVRSRVLIRALCPDRELQVKLLQIPGICQTRLPGKGVEADIEGDEKDSCAVLSQLVGWGVPVVEYKPLKVGLEDIFMNITKGELS
ncbi:MAG: ABC transporter ATP-binding protein [Phycisphaerae bacterium]|nr:ABC transporter ATP-binding protein [Phycisphaerae bacterium]